MSIAKVYEIGAASSKSFEDALSLGVAGAHKTHVRSGGQGAACPRRRDHRVPGQRGGHVPNRRAALQCDAR
jgi:hypothetical protein